MKKIIGILGVAFIALAVFFNTNAMNDSNGDFDLTSLLVTNTANAEVGCDTGTDWYVYWAPEYDSNVCKKPGLACCR